MAAYDQPVTTYSDTTPHVRVISDVIHLIDPVDTPFLDAIGGVAGGNSKFKVNLKGYKVELLEDEYAPTSDVAAQGTTITTNTTVLTVTDASIFQDGHVIMIDAEYMVVSAVDVTNNTLTVESRSYGGTNATHVTTSTIYIVGMARLEGDDADYGPVVDITAPYNYTSIYQHGLKVTGTQQVISQYGIPDEFGYQANKALPEKLRLLDLALFHGVRAAGSASTRRSFGGLGTFITNNSVNAGGAIAKSHIDTLMEYIMLDGGNPDLLVVHPSIGRDIKDLIDTSSFVRLGNENTQLGMSPITRISTQYGDLRMIMDRFCPSAKAYVLDSKKVGVYQLRPFQMHDLAVTGDSKKGELLGEFSFLVANDKAHGWIYGITT